MTANLFDQETTKPKKKQTLQYQVLLHLRAGHTMTEESYKRDFGGASISAVLHNLKIRNWFEPGENIVKDKVLDSSGMWIPSYRLVKEAPHVDFPQKEQEIDTKSFEVKEVSTGLLYVPMEPEEEPEIGARDFAGTFKEDAEDIQFEPETPVVSSIMVGVRGFQPELVIMFKGDEFKPLRHVMTHTEVRYLMTNLEAFMPKRKDG